MRSLVSALQTIALPFIISALCAGPMSAYAHDAKATYLANEGIMVEDGEYKILFDPFFHNDYSNYQLVPEDILSAIMSNTKPYHNIDAIFVSHSHGDHFAAEDMLSYLQKYPTVKLIAPDQAIEKMRPIAGFETIQKQLNSITLEYGEPPISLLIDNIEIDAVRIPHAGWPGRADVSNIVFRVTLPDGDSRSTYIHMGDADPDDVHFRPLVPFWEQKKTSVAFPPYWFFLTLQGNYILDDRINAYKNIGVHVPVKIPKELKQNSKEYFSIPGEDVEFLHKH